MDPDHPVLPDARRYRIVALRWDARGGETYLDLSLRHTETLASRRLRFSAPRDLRIGEGFETCVGGLVVADVSSRRIEGIGVEVYNLEARGSLSFVARDVVEVQEPQHAASPGAARTARR